MKHELICSSRLWPTLLNVWWMFYTVLRLLFGGRGVLTEARLTSKYPQYVFPPSHQVWRQHINSNCSLVLLEAFWFTYEWEVLLCECLHSASLLIGIQSCSKDKLSCFHIMNNGSTPHFQWYMNDRTAHLHWLMDNGKWYFTSEAKDDETERWLRDTLACRQKNIQQLLIIHWK